MVALVPALAEAELPRLPPRECLVVLLVLGVPGVADIVAVHPERCDLAPSVVLHDAAVVVNAQDVAALVTDEVVE